MGRRNSSIVRKLLYIAAGSALFAAANLLTDHLNFPGLQVVRPGIAVPVIFGALFGPIVGFLVGFLGSTGSDLLTFGFYWNWSLGNGLVGMVAKAVVRVRLEPLMVMIDPGVRLVF